VSCSCPLDAAAHVWAADQEASAGALQLQGQHGRSDTRCSYPEVFRQIYVQRGLPGLYAGIIPEYAKVIPGVAIAFCSYEVSHGAIVACRCAALWHTQHQPRGYEGNMAVPAASC
jgi:Mitochondrial carrier protein